MFPQFREIKDISVAFTINKMFQGFDEKEKIFKRIDAVGISIHRVSTDDMVLNPTLDVLSSTTHGGCNLQR